AEDGIRDRTVTGVQTCALPISQAGGLERGERVVVRATRFRVSARVERPHDTQAADRVRVGTGGRRRVAACCVPRAGGQHRRGREIGRAACRGRGGDGLGGGVGG